ncbi:MAG TPA: hypothetical protein VGV93_03560 [Acidimicrobiales bacterium]|nr:hypothetical protein [Acidimicrobiales bacterium]
MVRALFVDTPTSGKDQSRTDVPISLASSGGGRRLGVEGEEHRRFLALRVGVGTVT